MDLITTTHVGVMHGVRRQSVVRWIHAGILPAIRGERGFWVVERQVAVSFKPPVRKPRRPKYVGCEVEGCGRKHKAKRKCTPHYERWLRTGSTSPDKPIALVRFGQYNRTGAKQPARRFDLDDTDEL